MRNSYCPEAFYRGSAQEFNTIDNRAREMKRLRNVQSFSTFSTETRWKKARDSPGPHEYNQGNSSFMRASRSRLHPIFSQEISDNRKPIPKI